MYSNSSPIVTKRTKIVIRCALNVHVHWGRKKNQFSMIRMETWIVRKSGVNVAAIIGFLSTFSHGQLLRFRGHLLYKLAIHSDVVDLTFSLCHFLSESEPDSTNSITHFQVQFLRIERKIVTINSFLLLTTFIHTDLKKPLN